MEKIIPISNPRNNFIRFIKSLKKKKIREEKDKFLLEGINSVREALKSNIEIPFFVYSLDIYRTEAGKELMADLEKLDAKLVCVAQNVFNKLAETQTPQGIIAIPSRLRWDEENLFEKKKSFVLILDGIQDPGNMGTIVRIADALKVDGIILSPDVVDHYNPKTVRSTMGAIFRVPIFKSENLNEYVAKLRNNGYITIGTTLTEESVDYSTLDYKEMDKIALVIGNESRGISKELYKEIDKCVLIPIIGDIESLNAGVATGIAAYEIMRQKSWRL